MKLRSNCVLQSLTNPREQGAHYIECYSELDLTFYEKKKKKMKNSGSIAFWTSEAIVCCTGLSILPILPLLLFIITLLSPPSSVG